MAKSRSSRGKSERGIRVEVKPFGPTSEELSAIGTEVMTYAAVRKFVGRGKARLLYVEALDDDNDKLGKPRPPSRYRATLYDDVRQHAILVEGSLREPRQVKLAESLVPPSPSNAEFAAAVAIVRRDAAFAAGIERGLLEPYQPIPALVLNELPDGRVERRIAVGLLPRGADTLRGCWRRCSAAARDAPGGAVAAKRSPAQRRLVRRTAGR